MNELGWLLRPKRRLRPESEICPLLEEGHQTLGLADISDINILLRLTKSPSTLNRNCWCGAIPGSGTHEPDVLIRASEKIVAPAS